MLVDQPIETQENVEDEEFNVDYETDEPQEIDIDLTFPLSINAEDSRGTTLDDAIEDKMHLSNTEWPNEFMKIVMPYKKF